MSNLPTAVLCESVWQRRGRPAIREEPSWDGGYLLQLQGSAHSECWDRCYHCGGDDFWEEQAPSRATVARLGLWRTESQPRHHMRTQ